MSSGGRHATPSLSGFTDVSLIGSGGFADVYRARQAHLGRWVALKVFRVALHGLDATNQFRAECQAVSRVDDLNVIRVYDAGLLPDGRPYLVMELCDNSLQELVVRRGGALLLPEAAELGYRIATALLGAHSAQVIHGDVTPSNVLIRPSGAPVLADFGLAALRDYRGTTVGGFSPAYSAPEALRHDGNVDERTDVYGLGATLYAMVTGRAPFTLRWGETEGERNRRVLEEAVSWPPGVSISNWFYALVSVMLAKNPDDRPALSAVADELAERRFGQVSPPAGMPSAAGPSSSTDPAVVASAPPAVPTSAPPASDLVDEPVGASAPRQLPRPRRRPLLIIVVAAVVALCGGILIVAATGSQAADETPPTIRSATAPSITLTAPEPVGSLATRLTWSGSPGLTYTVVITKAGAEPRQEAVGEATNVTVATEPDAAYCFQIRGTFGQQDVLSNVQPLRGTC